MMEFFVNGRLVDVFRHEDEARRFFRWDLRSEPGDEVLVKAADRRTVFNARMQSHGGWNIFRNGRDEVWL